MKMRSVVSRILFLTTAAAVLPALVISIAARSISSKALKGSISDQQTELARRIAEQVNGEVRQAQQAVSLVAHSSFFSAGSRVDQYEALRNLIHEIPDFQEAMFVGPLGDELMKVSQAGAHPRLGRRSDDLHHPLLGSPFFSANRAPTILIGEPVRSFSNPTRTGAVLGKMSFMSLGQLMQQAHVGEHGLAYVVDDRGTLLAHPDEKLVLAHTNIASRPVVAHWLRFPLQPTGLDEFVDETGKAQIALAYPIPLLKSAVVVQQPREDVFAPILRMRNQFVLWASVSVALFIFFAIVVGWRILRPLQQLQQAAERIGRGDMDVKLSIRTGDELEDLASAFERMAVSLAELERLRRDLISMVVHDLKMPLATIMPTLDTLIIGDLGHTTPDQLHFLRMAHRSGQEMLMLIQNLLDVAKMEEGKLKLLNEPFAPVDWAQNVISSFRPLAEAGRKRLDFAPANNLTIAEGDVNLLSRVLGNLLSNALRHTFPETGVVTVSLYREGNFLAVQVRDNGEGIPEEDQERIFERFVQANGQKAKVRSGSGLGLTFCKMVVEAHGGRISVYSAPDEGSLFTFHLPIKPPEFYEQIPESRVETASPA